MLAYDPNASFLPGPYPIAERLRRIAEAGFAAFEMTFPQRVSLQELQSAKKRYGLRMVYFNMETDEANPRGYLTNPEAGPALAARLRESFALAKQLDCRLLHALVGRARPGLSREAQQEIVIKHLRGAAKQAEDEGVTLMIEVLNTIENPAYFLDSTPDGVAILQAVGSPNVRLMYDVYHHQLVEGNLVSTFRKYKDWIAHVQVADVPGRGKPGTGEINYPFLLNAMAESGYNGYVGLEYHPAEGDPDPFDWLPRAERGRGR